MKDAERFAEIKRKILSHKRELLLSYLFLALAILFAILFFIFFDRPLLSVLFFLPILPLLWLFFRYHRRAVPGEFFEWAMDRAVDGIAAAFRFLFSPIVKLLRKMGFLGGAGFLGGRDERSFHFLRPGQKSRRRGERMPKWKNLTSNAQRVRYLFMKYLNYRVKKGYVFHKTLTPAELREDLSPGVDPEDEDAVKGFTLLFDNYPVARYDEEHRAEELLPDPLIAEMRSLL